MNENKTPSRAILDGRITRFGVRLKEAMNGKKNTELAKKCNMSERVIRDYLAGKTYPSIDRLSVIADVLNKPIEWFVSDKEDTAENKVDNKNFVVIPDLNLKVAAGNGLCLINENDSIGQFILNKDWLRKQNLINASLAVFHVEGDSMEPTIHDEDIVLVNVKDEGWTGALSGIFVLRVEDLLFVKRIMVDPIKKGIHIISDNSMYQPDFIEFDDSTEAKLKILAKVEKVLTKPVIKSE